MQELHQKYLSVLEDAVIVIVAENNVQQHDMKERIQIVVKRNRSGNQFFINKNIVEVSEVMLDGEIRFIAELHVHKVEEIWIKDAEAKSE